MEKKIQNSGIFGYLFSCKSHKHPFQRIRDGGCLQTYFLKRTHCSFSSSRLSLAATHLHCEKNRGTKY